MIIKELIKQLQLIMKSKEIQPYTKVFYRFKQKIFNIERIGTMTENIDGKQEYILEIWLSEMTTINDCMINLDG